LDLDSMTPREAHNKLAEYQKMLKERKPLSTLWSDPA
jgi:hypothetical protein